MALTANLHRNLKKHPKPYTPSQFMPRWTRPAPQTGQQMLAVAKAITAALGGRINTKGDADGGPR